MISLLAVLQRLTLLYCSFFPLLIFSLYTTFYVNQFVIRPAFGRGLPVHHPKYLLPLPSGPYKLLVSSFLF